MTVTVTVTVIVTANHNKDKVVSMSLRCLSEFCLHLCPRSGMNSGLPDWSTPEGVWLCRHTAEPALPCPTCLLGRACRPYPPTHPPRHACGACPTCSAGCVSEAYSAHVMSWAGQSANIAFVPCSWAVSGIHKTHSPMSDSNRFDRALRNYGKGFLPRAIMTVSGATHMLKGRTLR